MSIQITKLKIIPARSPTIIYFNLIVEWIKIGNNKIVCLQKTLLNHNRTTTFYNLHSS